MTQDQPVNWRALCEELVLGWDVNGCDWKPQHQARWNATIERARAALAQSEPEVGRPTDEELDACADEFLDWNNDGIRAFARAVLVRYGRQPAPPAEGEVAELVWELQRMASQADEACQFTDAESLSSAADLLSRRHPAPVPVSERLPGPEDCDARGRYWGHINGCEAWVLGLGSPGTLNITHWLPATVLPIPAGEVE